MPTKSLFEDYITPNRIIDIKSSLLEGALSELLDACDLDNTKKSKTSKDSVLTTLLDREKTMTTYLGNGVIMPHTRLPIKEPYIFAIGRCPNGLQYEGSDSYRDVRLIFILLASNKEKNYLSILSSIARIFHDKEQIRALSNTANIDEFREEALRIFRGTTLATFKSTKFNALILKESAKIAQGAECSSIMLFGDTFVEKINLHPSLNKFNIILVTQSSSDILKDGNKVDSIITVQSFTHNRISQIRSAILIGLCRGLINYNSKVCCISGIPKSNQLDTVVVVDIQKEFQTVFNQKIDLLPPGVKPEVIERVIGIATELAVEGREGKPVGCLFVVGDTEKLKPYYKPLVLNPFYGYKEEDKNILNPFMDETVKEFSTIDGAFIIRGDGVLESAGSLIHAPEFAKELPSGLGSRHAAAAALSQATNCITITVSASTRQVTIFRRGQMLPLVM